MSSCTTCVLCQAVSSCLTASHYPQYVCDNALFLFQAFSSIVSQFSILAWPTACESWHCCISLLGSLINHVSFHNQQYVSGTASVFLCQAVSSIMSCPITNRKWVTVLNYFCQAVSSITSHPITNSMWVTLLYFFARQSCQPCLIPQLTGSEWHCFISLQGSLIHHVSSHDHRQ